MSLWLTGVTIKTLLIANIYMHLNVTRRFNTDEPFYEFQF